MPSPDVFLSALGYGLLLPAAATVIALLVALRLGGGEALALGVGLASGFAALSVTGQINWPPSQPRGGYHWPEEAWDWLPALGLLGCVLAAVEQLMMRWSSHLVRWLPRAVAAGIAAGLLVRAQSQRDALGDSWSAALVLAVLVLWGVLDYAARHRPNAVTPILLAVIGLAAGVLAELADFSTVAQLAAVPAGTLIGSALVAWRRPSAAVCRAGVPVVAVLLPGVLFSAYFNSYSDVPRWSYLLLLAAPLALGLAALLPLSEKPVWRRAALQAIAALVPLGAALALAAVPR